ncbi:MAG TPA: hypothetical protein VGM62_11895 [Chthoniobacterales bacterium]
MKQLISYLNDHLAGSVSAIELLDYLIETHEREPLAKFFQQLRADIVTDQEVLKKIVRRFNANESAIRQAGAWLGEKFARVKINLAGQKKGQLGLVEALEVLLLGITGKQLLWRALNASIGGSPLLRGVDLAKLEERAIEQIERVEEHRIEIAREVLLRTK